VESDHVRTMLGEWKRVKGQEQVDW